MCASSFVFLTYPPPVECKGRLHGKKMRKDELKEIFFLNIGIFLITQVSLQSVISCAQKICPYVIIISIICLFYIVPFPSSMMLHNNREEQSDYT